MGVSERKFFVRIFLKRRYSLFCLLLAMQIQNSINIYIIKKEGSNEKIKYVVTFWCYNKFLCWYFSHLKSHRIVYQISVSIGFKYFQLSLVTVMFIIIMISVIFKSLLFRLFALIILINNPSSCILIKLGAKSIVVSVNRVVKKLNLTGTVLFNVIGREIYLYVCN